LSGDTRCGMIRAVNNNRDMPVSAEDVAHIAKLARLSLNEQEIEMYATQLSGIFSYMSLLDEVDTDGVEQTCQVTGLEDITREDVAVPITEEQRAALIAAFPERVGDLLKVQAVFT
jgi:aspartyl-tRNA(Asn)/glutamyl-tRNA(Gln) amidotransferase subunit C